MKYLKIGLIFYLLMFIGCSNEEKLPLLSETSFQLDSDEHLLRLAIRMGENWRIEGDTTWCKMKRIIRQPEDSLFIYVTVNLLEQDRRVTWKISDDKKTEEIQIFQAAATGEYHYKLPIVFHILSYNEDPKDDELEDRLLFLLEQTNKFFKGENRKKIDINVEFVPVTCTPPPFNTPLRKPGIHWQYHENSDKINPYDFLDNVYGDADYLWDPNKYVNVYVYKFYRRSSSYGVSALPWTPENNALKGLLAEDRFYYEFPDDFVPSVNINQNFIYEGKDWPECPVEISVSTLYHELGHYLGLDHAYEEDYCEDTLEYDRTAYDNWYIRNSLAPWEELIKRTALDGTTFISTNFEDYEVGSYDEITPDQRKRIRHVLNYSPMIPGPKIPVKLNLKSKSTQKNSHGLVR